MAIKLSSLSLTAAGQTATMERGKLDPQKGKKVQGIQLKVTVTIANTTGGTLSGLSDAQKQAVLAAIRLDSLSYGANGAHKPYAAVDFARIDREMRSAYGSVMEGYSDGTTGFGQTVANTASITCVIYPTIPTGKNFRFPGMLGMGRSQSRTVELKFRQLVALAITGLTITGTTTIEVIPDAIPCKGDPFCVLPEYTEQSETDKTAKIPEGLPLRVTDRNAVHASATFTDLTVKIDDELIHDKVTPAEMVVSLNDSALTPATAILTDRETVLYELPQEVRFSDLPSGQLSVTQNVKNVASMAISALVIPLFTEEQFAKDLEDISTNIRKKTVKAVSLASIEGEGMPDRLKPYAGYRLVDSDDVEYDRYPGIACAPGGKAGVHVPDSVKARVKAIALDHEAKGEPKAAEAAVREAAVALPAAVQSPRGLGKGSGILEAVRRQIFG